MSLEEEMANPSSKEIIRVLNQRNNKLKKIKEISEKSFKSIITSDQQRGEHDLIPSFLARQALKDIERVINE